MEIYSIIIPEGYWTSSEKVEWEINAKIFKRD